jgi:hypothetical protein
MDYSVGKLHAAIVERYNLNMPENFCHSCRQSPVQSPIQSPVQSKSDQQIVSVIVYAADGTQFNLTTTASESFNDCKLTPVNNPPGANHLIPSTRFTDDLNTEKELKMFDWDGTYFNREAIQALYPEWPKNLVDRARWLEKKAAFDHKRAISVAKAQDWVDKTKAMTNPENTFCVPGSVFDRRSVQAKQPDWPEVLTERNVIDDRQAFAKLQCSFGICNSYVQVWSHPSFPTKPYRRLIFRPIKRHANETAPSNTEPEGYAVTRPEPEGYAVTRPDFTPESSVVWLQVGSQMVFYRGATKTVLAIVENLAQKKVSRLIPVALLGLGSCIAWQPRALFGAGFVLSVRALPINGPWKAFLIVLTHGSAVIRIGIYSNSIGLGPTIILWCLAEWVLIPYDALLRFLAASDPSNKAMLVAWIRNASVWAYGTISKDPCSVGDQMAPMAPPPVLPWVLRLPPFWSDSSNKAMLAAWVRNAFIWAYGTVSEDPCSVGDQMAPMAPPPVLPWVLRLPPFWSDPSVKVRIGEWLGDAIRQGIKIWIADPQDLPKPTS